MSISERKCIISFDEISLKEYLEYNKHLDFIEGFEDFGHLGRNNYAAKEAQARGLYATRKLTLTYFLSKSGVKLLNLKDTFLTVVGKAFEVDLLPVATVCDQGPASRSSYLQLGVTPANPNFTVNGKNIIAIQDASHLIKSLRNNLLNGDYLFNNQFVRLKDILKTYEIDKRNKCEALLKITNSHMYPKMYQKMNVKAVQVFSHSVANAIRTCISTGELESESAENTADFVEIVNNLFDCLKSRKF